VTPSNAAIIPEYIIPNIKYLVQDPEVSVRCCYAQCLAQVVDTAVRYLEMGQALKAHGTIKLFSEEQENDEVPFQVCNCNCLLECVNQMFVSRNLTILVCKTYRAQYKSTSLHS
jgi:hypothetical protein